MRSPRRWTIARPGRLVNAAATGSYRVEPGYVVPGEHTTVRADLADFLVRALAHPHWEHQAVAIASPGAQRAGASNSMRFAARRSRRRNRIRDCLARREAAEPGTMKSRRSTRDGS
jgi:hypothetical protein